MGAKFSGGGAAVFHDRTDTPGEIVTELVNASDGQGLHFDGAANTYVDCGDTTILDGATRMSVEVISATSSTAVGRVLGKDSAASCFKLQANADGTLTFRVNNGSSDGTATTSGTYNDGNPKHIVGTWDNATLSIYVNGNLDGTATLAGGAIPNTTDKIALGAKLDSGTTNASNFDGTIYRARLWNKSLTAPEVTATYENATVPFADQYGKQVYASAFASGISSFNPIGLTQAYNEDGVSDGSTSKDDCLKVYADGSSSHFTYVDISGLSAPDTRIKLFYYIPTANTNVDGLRISDGGTGGAGTLVTSTTTGAWTEFETTFTRGSTTRITIYAMDGGSTSFTGAASASDDIIYLNAVTVDSAGCVADYDLAFANPTQSTMVQDRAGAADGTSSASGVTQVTPIEQVNATAARIGTTAATPADGDLDVSGNVKIGSSLLIRGDNTASDPGMPYIRSDGNYLVINSDPDNGMYIQNDGSGDLSLCDGGGNVAIGGSTFETWTTDQTVLQIGGNGAVRATTAAGANGYLQLIQNAYYDSTNNRWEYRDTDEVSMYQQNAGTHQFRVAASSTADNPIVWTTALIISSAGLATFSNGIAVTTGGVKFPATQSASADANTLDDYEEGTWTGAFTAASGTITIDTSNDTGVYTRIGRLVTVTANFNVSAISSPSGALTITGLPFPAGNYDETAGYAPTSIFYGNLASAMSGSSLIARVYEGQSSINVYAMSTTTYTQPAGYIGASSFVQFSLTYMA